MLRLSSPSPNATKPYRVRAFGQIERIGDASILPLTLDLEVLQLQHLVGIERRRGALPGEKEKQT